MKTLLVVLAFWLSLPQLGWAQENQTALATGPHPVGFARHIVTDRARASLELYDHKKTANGNPRHRQFPIDIWYPTVADGSKKMYYQDYLGLDFQPNNQLTASNSRFDKTLNMAKKRLLDRGVSQADLKLMLGTAMQAHHQTPQAPGNFPLVIIPGGYIGSYAVAMTAESLASHGYVVCFVYDSKLNGTLSYADFAALLWRIQDTNMAINYIADQGLADTTNIAMYSYHSGGSIAALLQMTNPNVRAVVSIEGAEGWQSERLGFTPLSQHPWFDAQRIDVPYLRFQSDATEPDWYISNLAKNTQEFYQQALFADQFHVRLTGIYNDELGDYGYWSDQIAHYAELRSKKGQQAQQLIGSISAKFLAHTLQADQANQQPPTLLDEFKSHPLVAHLDHQAAQAKPPSSYDIEHLVTHQGLKPALTLIKQSTAQMTPEIIVEAVSALYFKGHLFTDVVTLLETAHDSFPHAYYPAFWLGFAYSREGQNQAANQAYLKAIERVRKHPSKTAEEKSRLINRLENRMVNEE